MKRVDKVLGIAVVALVAGLLVQTGAAWGHCEIPCGIYDDPLRFKLMREDITTIEKSMKQIIDLTGQQKPNYNQLIRWVRNKEDHANKLQHIVTQYFMTQRVKPVEAGNSAGYNAYVKKLTLLHAMLFQAMKAKQTTDLSHVEALRALLDQFEKAYSAGQ